MSKPRANGDEPQFDYDNYSRADQKAMLALDMEVQWLAETMDAHRADWTREEFCAKRDEFVQKNDELEQRVLAYVTYVPRAWFVDSAPADISVDTPSWWDYMRTDKLYKLKKLSAEARSPEAVSKN